MESRGRGLLALGGVMALGGLALWSRRASAAPKRRTLPTIDEYQPSPTTCTRDGQPYNIAAFPGPHEVAEGLSALGYEVSAEMVAASDAVAKTPLWRVGVVPARSDAVKRFQVRALELGLEGGSAADGVIGECTLRSLESALRMAKEGQWDEA